ncbi:MAG: hypothetical protein D3916_18840, partial [Candidatus Electrothrix sp. MAN1_4]|nr:hypothetical protein [Candidatus Electrothrix sp. MAN1_4]
MREEYIAHLESLLDLRDEENRVGADKEASADAIEAVGQTLLNDILLYEYEGIVKRTERELSAVTEYDAASLEKLNVAFAARSKHLELVWGNVLLLSEFLETYPFFKGLADVFIEHKSEIALTESIDEVNQHIEWIQDVWENREIIEETWKNLKLLHEILGRHKFLKSVAKEFRENAINLSKTKNVDKVDSYHTWIKTTYSWIEKIEKNIEISNELTNKYPLFKGIKEKKYELEKNIYETHRFDSISRYDSYLNEIVRLKEKMIYIDGNIKWLH